MMSMASNQSRLSMYVARLLMICLLVVTAGATSAQQKKLRTPPKFTDRSVWCDGTDFDDSINHRMLGVSYCQNLRAQRKKKLVIIVTEEGDTTNNYEYISFALAEHDYYTMRIHHMPLMHECIDRQNTVFTYTDSLNSGASSIYAAIIATRNRVRNPAKDITLIGHGRYGDMCLTFAGRYPDMVAKVISLNSTNYPTPLLSTPKLYYIQTSDNNTRPGIIPTPAQQKQYGITVAKIKCNAAHIGWQTGRDEQNEITALLWNFIRNP